MTGSELLDENKVRVPVFGYKHENGYPLLSFYKFLNKDFPDSEIFHTKYLDLGEKIKATISPLNEEFSVKFLESYTNGILKKIYLKIDQYYLDETINQFIQLIGMIRSISLDNSSALDFDIMSLYNNEPLKYRMFLYLFKIGFLLYKISPKNVVESDQYRISSDSRTYSLARDQALLNNYKYGILISSSLEKLKSCRFDSDCRSQGAKNTDSLPIKSIDIIFDNNLINNILLYSHSKVNASLSWKSTLNLREDILELLFHENQLILVNLADNSKKIIKSNFKAASTPYRLLQKLFQESSCELGDSNFNISNNNFGKFARDFNLSTALFKKFFLRNGNKVSLNSKINLEDINDIVNGSKNKESCKTLFIDNLKKIAFNIDTLKFNKLN